MHEEVVLAIQYILLDLEVLNLGRPWKFKPLEDSLRDDVCVLTVLVGIEADSVVVGKNVLACHGFVELPCRYALHVILIVSAQRFWDA